MTNYQIPYICPECDHNRWVVADPDDPTSKAVKCPNCGFEDTVNLSPSSITIPGEDLDELDDVIDDLIDGE